MSDVGGALLQGASSSSAQQRTDRGGVQAETSFLDQARATGNLSDGPGARTETARRRTLFPGSIPDPPARLYFISYIPHPVLGSSTKIQDSAVNIPQQSPNLRISPFTYPAFPKPGSHVNIPQSLQPRATHTPSYFSSHTVATFSPPRSTFRHRRPFKRKF
jgi:hypothetical protein